MKNNNKAKAIGLAAAISISLTAAFGYGLNKAKSYDENILHSWKTNLVESEKAFRSNDYGAARGYIELVSESVNAYDRDSVNGLYSYISQDDIAQTRKEMSRLEGDYLSSKALKAKATNVLERPLQPRAR